MTGMQAAMLGHRLHLQYGPIDLVIEAAGNPAEITAAYSQARQGFEGVLEGVAADLPLLRSDARAIAAPPHGLHPVALCMIDAVQSHDGFVTPMAAVAGSVADHVLRAMVQDRVLLRATVNNGGDIALFLSGGESCVVGLAEGEAIVPVTIDASDEVGGIATSGWRGRSYSLGIADFVTVFARDAASADVAATLIANAVDLPDCPRVERQPATTLSPDSDLGERLVTTGVAPLNANERAAALESGRRRAIDMIELGLILSARLGLQGQTVNVGPLPGGMVCGHDAPEPLNRERHPA